MSILLHDSWQTARKQHRCSLCCELINPGERYYRQHCVDNEHRWSFKSHEECEKAARWAIDALGLRDMEDIPVEDAPMFRDEILTPYRQHLTERDHDADDKHAPSAEQPLQTDES